MVITNIVRKILHPLSIDVVRYPSTDLDRRIKLLSHFEINTILDIGANKGQYGKLSRKLGFNKNIISFEPLSSVFRYLKEASLRDSKWTIYNMALGNKKETITINVSDNLYSSSILDITQTHLEGAPESVYMDNEEIKVDMLDNIFPSLTIGTGNIFLKLDVQGYEKNVLDGAKETLNHIKGIQIEMSLQELYKGEMLFYDMIAHLRDLGFNLHSLENGFYNKDSGKLLQVDGIFFRE